MNEPILDFRKRVFELLGKLSKRISDKVRRVASQLHYNEKWYFEDVLRRAAGNSLPEPCDISIEELEGYMKFWDILSKHFDTSVDLKRFETDFVQPVLDDDEAIMPNLWVDRFVDRLEKDTKEKMVQLHSDYGLELKIPIEDIGRIAYLRPLTFQYVEREFIVPSLDAAIADAINTELARVGLRTKKVQGPKRKHPKPAFLPSVDERLKTAKAYIEAMDANKTSKPTLQMISETSKRPKSTLAKEVLTLPFLTILREELEKKVNQSKIPETKDFWSEGLVETETIAEKISERIRKNKERPFRDDIQHSDDI